VTTLHACSSFAAVEDFTNGCDSCDCTLTADQVGAYLDEASDVLYWLSGGRYMGGCSATVRPVRRCSCGCFGWRGSPWSMTGFGPSLCGWCMSCGEVDMIQLRTPVLAITEVKVDGVSLSPVDYALTPQGKIYRTATGTRPPRWPSQQDLWKPDTEENTFSISFHFGQASPHPAWVVNACVELACEMAAQRNNGRTKLPQGTTSVTMQNVSVGIQTKAEAIKEAKTYLPAVAQFIGVTNPAQAQSWIYSPDGGGAWTFPLS